MLNKLSSSVVLLRKSLVPVSFFFALPLFLLASQDADPTARAVALMRMDAFDEAERLLEELPESARVLALRGEVYFRRARLDQARAHYRRALEMDAGVARAHFGLGKLALGKMQAADAIASFTRALDLEPGEPVYHFMAAEAWAVAGDVTRQAEQLEAYLALEPTYDPDRLVSARAALDVIEAFGAKPIGDYTLPEDPEPVPFTVGINLVFADVQIEDTGPFEFVVDTGASQTVLASRLIDEMGLTPIASTVIHGMGGAGRVESGVYRLDRLEFGNIEAFNVPVGSLSDPLLSQVADGIFSTLTFAEERISIDYPRSRIEFNASDPGPGADHLPVWIFHGLILVPLEVNGIHAGLFLLDTGAVTTVLSHGMAETLGVTEDTPGAAIDLSMAGIAGFSGVVLRVPDVTFSTAGHQEVFPQVIAMDMGEISRTLGIELAGVIGYDFLNTYRVTIDYPNAEVTLSKSE